MVAVVDERATSGWPRCWRGRGGLALLAGPLGIGKTTLATARGREAAARGAVVLVGQCHEHMAAPPYGPWRDLFRRYPACPALPPLPATVAACGTAGGSASQADLFGQIAAFLRAGAARWPLVLVLDDLHGADPASLDLLRYVAPQLAALPALIVAAYRDDEGETGRALGEVLPSLVRRGRPLRLDLASLVAALGGLAACDGRHRRRAA